MKIRGSIMLLAVCALSLPALLFPGRGYALEPVIEADFEKCTTADYINGAWSIENGGTSFRLIIAGLNTKKPYFKGNLGTGKLVMLPKGRSPVLYLLEPTPAGHFNMLTLFLNKNAVTFVKNYPMPSGEPFSMVCTGKYK
jgi:hypothetical protein